MRCRKFIIHPQKALDEVHNNEYYVRISSRSGTGIEPSMTYTYPHTSLKIVLMYLHLFLLMRADAVEALMQKDRRVFFVHLQPDLAA
jgi:hypothetical protein